MLVDLIEALGFARLEQAACYHCSRLQNASFVLIIPGMPLAEFSANEGLGRGQVKDEVELGRLLDRDSGRVSNGGRSPPARGRMTLKLIQITIIALRPRLRPAWPCILANLGAGAPTQRKNGKYGYIS